MLNTAINASAADIDIKTRPSDNRRYADEQRFWLKYISNTDNVTGIKYIEFDFQKKVE